MGKQKLLRFKTADGDRLIRLDHIVECIPMVELETGDADASQQYRGLLHYRGCVLPVFEPAATDRQRLDPSWFLIILDDDNHQIAVIARDIDDIESRPADCCRQLNIGGQRSVTVVSFDDDVVRVVEPQALF